MTNGKLHMNVYLPPRLQKQEERPAIVFLNAIGDDEGEIKLKNWVMEIPNKLLF